MASPELEAKIKEVKEKHKEKQPESFDQQVARVKEKYGLSSHLKRMKKAMSDNIEKKRPKVGTAGDSEKYSAGYGVNPSTKVKGVSNAGLEVRAGDTEAAKKEHKGTLKEIKKMPKPDLGKSGDLAKGDKLTKRRDDNGNEVGTSIPSNDASAAGSSSSMNTKPQAAAAGGGLGSVGASGVDMGAAHAVMQGFSKSEDQPSHTHKGVHLKHMKMMSDGHGAYRILDGHHAGKWTKLHESEVVPFQKSGIEPMAAAAHPGAQTEHMGSESRSPVKNLRKLKSHLPEHLEKHADGASDEKLDRCVDHVKEGGGKYNAYAVCAASLKKMKHYAAKDKMEKGTDGTADEATNKMRHLKAALNPKASNGDQPMEKSKDWKVAGEVP